MKKQIGLALSLFTVVLTACSTPPQQSSVPMDMQTVEAYRHRVSKGSASEVKAPKALPDEPLNQSDMRKKRQANQPRLQPVIRPHIGYHLGRGHHGHYSGIGIGTVFYGY